MQLLVMKMFMFTKLFNVCVFLLFHLRECLLTFKNIFYSTSGVEDQFVRRFSSTLLNYCYIWKNFTISVDLRSFKMRRLSLLYSARKEFSYVAPTTKSDIFLNFLLLLVHFSLIHKL